MYTSSTLAADATITDPRDRCRLYVTSVGGEGFDQEEYNGFGPDGCTEFDPTEFPRF